MLIGRCIVIRLTLSFLLHRLRNFFISFLGYIFIYNKTRFLRCQRGFLLRFRLFTNVFSRDGFDYLAMINFFNISHFRVSSKCYCRNFFTMVYYFDLWSMQKIQFGVIIPIYFQKILSDLLQLPFFTVIKNEPGKDVFLTSKTSKSLRYIFGNGYTSGDLCISY